MNSTRSKGNRRPTPAPNNFLEALRDLGKGVASDATYHISRVASDVTESFGLPVQAGTLKPNESYSLPDLKQAEKTGENRAEARFNTRLRQVQEEERQRYLRAESESKAQVSSLLQEIQLLAKSTTDLSKEIRTAALQAPVSPGIYHRNFFEKLRSFIKTMRLQIQDSKNWLATTNSRAAKKNYYWGQVGKSGSKFMLSQERYMVTSTG